MALNDLLVEKRTAILKTWLRRVLETYPDESGRFLGDVKDPFANPVGAALSRELALLFDGLVEGGDSARTLASLDNVVKIRAVQDFTPSQAVGFVFLLKQVVEKEFGGEVAAGSPAEDWRAFEAKVDGMALSAFDLYSAARERLCDIRIGEMRKRMFVIERASRLFEKEGPESEGGS